MVDVILFATPDLSFSRTMVGEDGEDNIPHREWLVMFDQILNEVKGEMKQQGREDEFIGARVSSYAMSFIQRC